MLNRIDDGWRFSVFFSGGSYEVMLLGKVILPSVFIHAGITHLTSQNNHKYNRLGTLQSADFKNNRIKNHGDHNNWPKHFSLFSLLSYSACFMKSVHSYSCFPPNNHHLYLFISLLSNFNDPSVSFSLIAPCPLVSTSHSQRHCRSRLRGVLFVIGSDDLHVPPWHRVNYSLHRNYTCVPRESPPTTSRQKKMSLLPWWCQVMDFMFASGVQVKTWGSHWRWPSQPRHLYWSCVQTYRLPWGSIKGGSGASVSMSDLFVCCGLLLRML